MSQLIVFVNLFIFELMTAYLFCPLIQNRIKTFCVSITIRFHPFPSDFQGSLLGRGCGVFDIHRSPPSATQFDLVCND